MTDNYAYSIDKGKLLKSTNSIIPIKIWEFNLHDENARIIQVDDTNIIIEANGERKRVNKDSGNITPF